MKLLKICFAFLLITIFSACEVQDVWHVDDTVEGTPSKADTVLPHKFNNKSDSLIELRNEQLPQLFHK
jgi:hypothetical protein